MKTVVRKKIKIKANHKIIFEQITNFNNWINWSPWFVLDKSVKIKTQKTPLEAGHELTWTGEILEQGKIVIKKISDTEIEYLLTFLNSQQPPVDMRFTLKKIEDKLVDVTWEMKIKIPLLASKDKIKKLTEKDCERGLIMLKDYCELGGVPAKTIDEGIRSMSSINYIGIETKTTVENISETIKKNFKILSDFLEKEDKKASEWFTGYEKYDYIDDEVVLMTCISIEDFDLNTDFKKYNKDFIKGNVESSRVYRVSHIGEYKHLANAWAMATIAIKTKRLKHKDYTIERYVDISSKDITKLKTEILIPIE